jgi:hypothetical protein
MRIDGNTKLSAVLGMHPDVLGYVIELDPQSFRKLEQPLVRRAMADRLTLERVAKMTGVALSKIVLDICRIVGLEVSEEERVRLSKSNGQPKLEAPSDSEAQQTGRPVWAEDLSEDDVHVVESLGEEPDGDLKLKSAALEILRVTEPGDVLIVKHSREPYMLYSLWDEAGHERYSEQVGPREWWIFVRKHGGGNQ